MIPKFNIKLTGLCLTLILTNHLTTPAVPPVSPIDKKLLEAAKTNDIQQVTDLLDQGANPNAEDPMLAVTPLINAIKYNQTEIVKLLIKYGADINDKGVCNSTPLHLIAVNPAYRGNKKIQANILELLISQGANVNAKNFLNATPLHEATAYDQPKIAELLISQGANVNAKNCSNTTPLHNAAQYNQPNMAEILINYGADINAKDNKNQTPLFYAIKKNTPKIAKLLLSRGADMYAENINNETVFDILQKRNKEEDRELLQLLQEYQAFTPQGLEEDSMFKHILKEAVEQYYQNQPELIKQIITMPNVTTQSKLKKYFNPKFLRSLYYQFDKPRYFALLQEDLELLEENQRENLEKAEAADYKRLMEK